MVRSGIPVPSLLALFGALLVLFPEMLMGDPEGFYDVPLTDPIVPLAVAFAVAKHNDRRKESANYFKLLRVVQMQAQVEDGKVMEYHLMVELVKTTCQKNAGLFGALLVLCPEQLLGNTEVLSDVPATDPEVANVLIFAVEQYNKDRIDDSNYYKIQYVLKLQSQVTNRSKYCLAAEMVRTDCEKTLEKSYHEIQKCGGLLGQMNNPVCYFKIMVGSSPNNFNLPMSACTTSLRLRPYNYFCSG